MDIQEADIESQVDTSTEGSLSLKQRFLSFIGHARPIPKGQIASLDVARFIASVFIVIRHNNPFYVSSKYLWNMDWAPFMFSIHHILRIGLLFFLLTAGFLFGNSLNKGNPLIPRTLKAVKRLSWIFFIWALIYALSPFSYTHLFEDFLTLGQTKHYYWHFVHIAKDPLLLIMTGNKYHLWFLPSLITSLSVIALFLYFKKEHYLLIFAVVFYFISSLSNQEPLMSFVDGGIYLKHLRSYTQGFAFVTLGWWLSTRKTFAIKDALKYFALAICVQVLQDIGLWHLYQLEPKSFTPIGLLPATIGLFILIMCVPNFGKNTVFHKFGQMSLGIYVLHPLIIDILRLFNRKIMHLNIVMKDITFPLVTIETCLFLTAILNSSPLTKRLTS